MIEIIMSHADAVALGLRRYFTGKPCRNGHFTERYTATKRCVACVREDRRWVDPVVAAAYARKWRAANREHSRDYIRTYMRAYYHSHPLTDARRDRRRLNQLERRHKLKAARTDS